MDRNTVIATVLIAIIMFAWLWLLPPPPAPPPADPAGAARDTQSVAEPEPASPQAQAEALPPAVTDTTIAGAQEGEARTITVETDLYQAVFSTRGATLQSFLLKEYYKFDQETPVQLVDTAAGGALSLYFTTPANHNVDTRSFYFEADFEGDTLRVPEEGRAALTFTANVGSGTIRQTYTFEAGEYEVGLQVAQENAAAFATNEGYELVWTGGVPFTEGDEEYEARYMGAYARSGGDIVSVTLDSGSEGRATPRGSVSWVAVKNKYFTSVLIPEGPTRGAELVGERIGAPGGPDFKEDYTARLLMPPAADEPDVFRLYLGPMEFYRITAYNLGLYDMVDYGWDFFEWMTRPFAKYLFIPVFTFLGNFLPNYGLVIIVFSILIKLLVWPLTKSSYKSMARMRELQPKMEAIKEQYADNPQKQQEAMMKMYRETGVNPVGGCLPMLLQYPIIIALWQFLPQSLEIRQQGFLWANDLSSPDVILQLPFTIPFYGDFVAGFTLLMGVSMVIQMRLQTAAPTNAQAKVLVYVMPLMLFVIFNRLAAGLSLYYLCYNLLSAVQQKFINKSLEAEGAGATANGKGSRKDAAKAKAVQKKRQAPSRKRSKKQRT